jgi:hypothetical protein
VEEINLRSVCISSNLCRSQCLTGPIYNILIIVIIQRCCILPKAIRDKAIFNQTSSISVESRESSNLN